MGNFSEHYRTGKVVSLFCGATVTFIILSTEGAPIEAVIVGIVAGITALVTSLLPDVDHHASKPRKAAGYVGLLAAIGAIASFLIYAPGWISTLGSVLSGFGLPGDPTIVGFSVLLTVFVAIVAKIGDLFDSLTTHRGFTHSIPFVALMFILTLISVQHLDSLGGIFAVFGTIYGLFVALAAAIGVLAHLTIDIK